MDILERKIDLPTTTKHEYSSSENGVTSFWEISSLWRHTRDFPVTDWRIPESFSDDWGWGVNHVSEHIGRVLDSDLTYPILVCDGVVVDGSHRVCKALSLGWSNIPAKMISEMPPPTKTKVYSETDHASSNFTYGDMIQIVKAIHSRKKESAYKYRHPADGI